MKRILIPAFAVLLGLVSCRTPEVTDTPQKEHRDLYGVGIVWSDWLAPSEIPEIYRTNPRSYDQAQMDMIVAAGGTACHGSFDWVGIEPEQGSYNWSRADQMVEDAVSRGLTMYAYIGNTPDWATPSNDLPGYRTPPDEEYAADFEAYCEAVARRYRGKVEHFFFWNEPNGCSWVNDGCSNGDGYALYTKWLQRAYTALKRGNPDCVVAAGSLDYGSYVPTGYTYIEGMYRAGAKGYFDAIDIHPYDEAGLHWQAVRDTRRVMEENGDGDKAIWISEYGWPDSRGEETAQRLTSVLTTLAGEDYSYVTYARYLVLCDLPGGTEYGMMERNLTPRPVYNAFAAIAGQSSAE